MKRHITVDEHRLWVIFHQTHDLLARYEDRVLSEANLTREQHLILWLIEFMSEGNDNPVILSDVASSLFRKLNTISAIVDRMEKNGLISKFRDLPDQRTVRLTITPKGKAAYKNAGKPNSLLIKRVFSDFSPDEMHTLRILLKKLRAKINKESNLGKIKMDPEMSNPERIARFLKKNAF